VELLKCSKLLLAVNLGEVAVNLGEEPGKKEYS
jgi:hypothetical protein